ncbi:DUF4174 domain-containing protein [Pararhizobium arenae]|uniref:DUF4174 domain-containing protein n=1 Tax=Pararhizobium arenae TaxID=1856850 RepID=UPI000B056496|nr:DUF4174 domain-containing protein [Pararhizobium arenae]
MDSLSQLEWKNRVVLVFGQTYDEKVLQQIDLLKSKENELADRDMVIIRVSVNEVHAVYGKASGLDASAIRREAHMRDERFKVLLIGKDGDVKLRSDRIVGATEMFGLIDSMPMRNAEKG